MQHNFENSRETEMQATATEPVATKLSQEAFQKEASPLDKAYSFIERNPVIATIGALTIAAATFALTRGRWSIGSNVIADSSESFAEKIAPGDKFGWARCTNEGWNESNLIHVDTPKMVGQLTSINGVGLRVVPLNSELQYIRSTDFLEARLTRRP